MITIYFSDIESAFNTIPYSYCLKQLPLAMRARIERYHQESDQKLGVLGKMLLFSQLEHYKLSEILSLSNIRFNEFGRPSFDHPFDFNISHSGKMVVCAAGTEGRIGTDLEEVKDINFDDFYQQFSSSEWTAIKQDKNPTSRFFEFWTRKEAFVKAIGTGISILNKLIVLVCCNSRSIKSFTIRS